MSLNHNGVADMSTKSELIDGIVIAQAEDDSAWEAPISVRRDIPTLRQRVKQALANVGLLATLDPATTVERYASRAGQRRLSPLKIGGKPVSEIIVEERSRW